MSIFDVVLPVGDVTICGVIDPQRNRACPPQVRKAARSNKLSLERVKAWRNAMLALLESADNECKSRVSESISGLHDVKTAASVIMRNAESLIRKQPGDTEEARLASADDALKALYKGAHLLNSRLEASGYLSNPDSITLGRRRARPVYRQIDRMHRMFIEVAAHKHVSIVMTGHSDKELHLFDSFDVIPLILIDNAIKYTFKSEKITVTVKDVPTGIHMEVQSRGPLVPEEQRARIFERGFRTEAAKKIAADGFGLGLHIASLVAKAHQFRILYETKPVAGWQADRGVNVFSFTVEDSRS